MQPFVPELATLEGQGRVTEASIATVNDRIMLPHSALSWSPVDELHCSVHGLMNPLTTTVGSLNTLLTSLQDYHKPDEAPALEDEDALQARVAAVQADSHTAASQRLEELRSVALAAQVA